MARRLHRCHLTISRELRRNFWRPNNGYSARAAQMFYTWRLKQRASRFRLKKQSIRKYVVEKLSIGWPPKT